MSSRRAGLPIVVGVDGRHASMQAIAWAARAAALRSTSLLLLHARRPDELPWQVVGLLRAGLRHARAADPQARLRVRAVPADAADALRAVGEEAALLVLGLDPIGPHGSYGPCGSIVERAAQQTRCPVVLVPGPGSTASRPDVVALVTGDPPGMCVAVMAAREAARRSATLFVYVRHVDGNPSTVELADRAMVEITFDNPTLPVRLKLLDERDGLSMVWEPVDRLAMVITSADVDTTQGDRRADPYGMLLARQLGVPVMLVSPLTFRSMRLPEAARAAERAVA